MSCSIWQSIKTHQACYRKREICLFRMMRVVSVVQNTSIVVFLVLSFYFTHSTIVVLLVLLVVVSVLFAAVFLSLYCLMHNYHFYEFKRTRKQMVMFAGLILFTNFLNIHAFYQVVVASWHHDRFYSLQAIIAEDCQQGELSVFFFLFLYYNLGLPGLMASVIVLKVKSHQDILQGINKLDYLLKVSLFQKYKGCANERRDRASTTNSFEEVRLSLTSEELNL